MNYLIKDQFLIFEMHFYELFDEEFFLIIVHNYQQLLHVHKLVSKDNMNNNNNNNNFLTLNIREKTRGKIFI
jgi:hypothetical protein